MKTVLFCLLGLMLCWSPLQLSAQNQEEYRHDLSVSFGSVQLVSAPFSPVVFYPKIMYRTYRGNLGYRFQAEGIEVLYKPDDQNVYSGNASQKSGSVFFGIQYQRDLNRFRAYAFADLGLGFLDLMAPDVSYYSSYYQSERIVGLKGQTGVGLQYQLAKRWTLGLESSASMVYGRASAIAGGVDPYAFNRLIAGPRTYWGGQGMFSPVSAFWVSWRFGKQPHE